MTNLHAVPKVWKPVPIKILKPTFFPSISSLQQHPQGNTILLLVGLWKQTLGGDVNTREMSYFLTLLT